jgi:hypothetical protein
MTKDPKTQIMVAAAAVITRPEEAIPPATAAPGSPVWRHSSRTRESSRRRARDHRGAGAEAHYQPVGAARRQGAHHARYGQEGQADLQRVVAEDPAQVEGAEEERPEHARGAENLDQVRACHVAGGEDPQRHERVARCAA